MGEIAKDVTDESCNENDYKMIISRDVRKRIFDCELTTSLELIIPVLMWTVINL